MPVETREAQSLACFGQPAHPDKGGTEALALRQTVNPRNPDAVSVSVVRVPVGPRPQTEQLADDGVVVQLHYVGQADDGRVVRKVVTHFQPLTGHP
jgi:hypothetical protein